LQKIIENPGREIYARGETKKKILELINQGTATSTKLSKKMNRRLVTINHFLRKLEDEEKIKRGSLKREGIIWSLKND